MKRKEHPGIVIPPPLIYVACFLLSIGTQKLMPMNKTVLNSNFAIVVGMLFILLYLLTAGWAIRQFVKTKNTVVTIKPAKSLETSGIYGHSRNPMYLGLLFLYLGLALLIGNWWTILFTPLLITVLQLYVIKREEDYLSRAFGEQYFSYTRSVRRWI
jgi:protein-S-isoprenylcysteine O-methyltransferase Ste14